MINFAQWYTWVNDQVCKVLDGDDAIDADVTGVTGVQTSLDDHAAISIQQPKKKEGLNPYPKQSTLKVSYYTEFLKGIVSSSNHGIGDINRLETYISLEGWDVPYKMPQDFYFARYEDFVCLYKGDTRICRFDKDEDVARRMIGADVERIKTMI